MTKTNDLEKIENDIEVPSEEPDGETCLSAEERIGENLAKYLRMISPNYKTQVKNLSIVFEKKLDDVQMQPLRSEIDRLNALLEARETDVSMWMSKYEESEELRKKAEHERDLLKEMMHERPASKKYKVRQIAILALALCRKALVVPKNKKKIALLFSHLTGVSQNTISQNLCDTYSDEEIQDIAEPLKDTMPELAEYLIENKFAG